MSGWTFWFEPVLSRIYSALPKDTTQCPREGSNAQILDLEPSTLPLSHRATYVSKQDAFVKPYAGTVMPAKSDSDVMFC